MASCATEWHWENAALLWLVEHDYCNEVKVILEANQYSGGASLDKTSIDGEQLLSAAVRAGCQTCTQMILERCGDMVRNIQSVLEVG
jgi:hypothetical protein